MRLKLINIHNSKLVECPSILQGLGIEAFFSEETLTIQTTIASAGVQIYFPRLAGTMSHTGVYDIYISHKRTFQQSRLTIIRQPYCCLNVLSYSFVLNVFSTSYNLIDFGLNVIIMPMFTV